MLDLLNSFCSPALANSKSILMHLKKAGSPSSTSMEDSDIKTVSVGTNVQLRASSGFERSHAMLLNSSSNIIPGSDAQGLLSALSNAPPVPLMIQNVNHQLSVRSRSSEEAAAYQNFLEGVGGPAGTNLSLSSKGGVGLGSHRSSSGLNFCGGGPPVPWLKPGVSRPDKCQSSRGRTMNMGHLAAEKSACGSHHAVESFAATVGQVFSTSIQNLLPCTQPREMSGSEWIVGNQDSTPHFICSSLSRMSGGQLGGHQYNPLENPAETRGGALLGEQERAVDFLQNGSEGVVTETAGTDPKFPAFQALRPGSFGSSIYDSHHNGL